MNLQRLLVPSSILLTLLFSASSQAADQWYQIEIILFGQNHSATTVREPIPENTFIPDSLTAVKLSIDGVSHLKRGSSTAFKMLDRNKFSLKHHYNKLSANPAYSPIMHVAWRQPVGFRKKGFKVKIEGGRALIPSGGNDNTTSNSPTTPSKEISGIIIIKKSRYFHIKSDLLYRHKSSSADGAMKVYRMKGSRRMKPRELHYIDHPMFGMLVYIRKI
ncbi:hypothetical protein MNBD_GAMMA12-1574 [hydrothermal vent metagenome]|uniref:Uncharacterized protein n=1 Tax=hydrothermal vent metagenome TaxID=652676 RepID=A0A3B0Z4W2_9ZZZZ